MTGKTAAEKLQEKAERLRNASQHTTSPETPTADAHPAAAATTVRAKPIRSTVDLSPHHHATLKAWSGETAVMIGSSRVTTQDVLRALVARLLTDETLARKIREDLRTAQ